MKNYVKWIVALIAIILIGLAIYYFFSLKNNNNSNYSSDAQRLSAEENIQNQDTNIMPEEKEISNFSTKILIDDDNRDTNLKLTASKINGTVINPNETFSFNEIAGNPTPEKGYEKAGIFVNGKKEKGYGGGNCQVSTTIYDAVLKVKGLEVTERHEHGKEVGYVKQGKDATVVYDELDLKFKNNLENAIKLYVDVTEEKINVKIVELINS